MELFGRYILQTQKIVDNKSFNTANKVIDYAADLNDVFYVFVDLMTTQMSEFQKRDSGWELQFIMYVEINLNKFCAFGGSSYIKLPSFIEKKKGITQHNTHREEAYDSLATVNVVIAAYVTTQVHLELYSYLELLGGRVLYYDTDSYDVPMGEFLGEITDELESYGPGSYITEFVSGGPKKYAYRVFSTRDKEERVVCKVKGISLNYAASQLVNFEIIKSMILEPMSAGPVSITSRNILRTK
ncbi:hypothetical protein NQ318_023401 [Aromia moschata]|uniref:DNA-directed DNA polymerase n=1 Tax=Aromia moschata TaxID=1265417 RepID=A0AAV8YV60_9CUCU|nr:hypothetical protein NQ318_023401 [Aromia moschata]